MPEMLTLVEVCTSLKVRRQTLKVWWEKGLFPRPVRIGRTVRFRREDVENALQSPTATR